MVPSRVTRGVLVFAIEHHSPPLADVSAVAARADGIEAIDHVVVVTADVDEARRVYGEVFGLRLALDREFPQRGLHLLFFRVGGVTVEIGGRIGAAVETDREDELWGVAYRVTHIEAARERLAAAGVDVSDVRTGQKKGTRVCTVRDRTHGVATLLISAEGGDA